MPGQPMRPPPTACAPESVLAGEAACPVLQGPVERTFRDLVRQAGGFSMELHRSLTGRPPAEQVAWTRASLFAGRG